MGLHTHATPGCSKILVKDDGTGLWGTNSSIDTPNVSATVLSFSVGTSAVPVTQRETVGSLTPTILASFRWVRSACLRKTRKLMHRDLFR